MNCTVGTSLINWVWLLAWKHQQTPHCHAPQTVTTSAVVAQYIANFYSERFWECTWGGIIKLFCSLTVFCDKKYLTSLLKLLNTANKHHVITLLQIVRCWAINLMNSEQYRGLVLYWTAWTSNQLNRQLHCGSLSSDSFTYSCTYIYVSLSIMVTESTIVFIIKPHNVSVKTGRAILSSCEPDIKILCYYRTP